MKTKMPTHLLPSSHYTSDYTIFCHPEDKPDDMMDPKIYAHVAGKLKPGDTILFVAEDISWECLTRVRAAGKHDAILSKIYETAHETAIELTPASDEGLVAKWRGPARKWSVVREADGMVLKEDYETRGQAENYIRNRVKAAA